MNFSHKGESLKIKQVNFSEGESLCERRPVVVGGAELKAPPREVCRARYLDLYQRVAGDRLLFAG